MIQLPLFGDGPGPAALLDYDHILVNSSAGKDSQAMLDVVARRAEAEGVSNKVLVVHCDLGRVEWPGTLELAREHAAHYGLRFEVVRREGRGDLLAEVRRRGKWMSPRQRYCTSYYKREPVLKLIRRLHRDLRMRIGSERRFLNCLGFRAQESPRRKKMPPFARNKYGCCKSRVVDDWLPLHGWNECQVWDRIRRAGTRPHPAYSLGMTRLSCRFCIFAPRSQLVIAARANPDLFAEYVEVERQLGHTFRVDLALADLAEAVAQGEEAAPDDGAWNM